MDMTSYLPLVSVVIPTYNRCASLRRALDSLEAQTYPRDRYEAIVIDDGSTDGTGDLPWNAFSMQVQYYRQSNSGATQARNAGAEHSTAEILVFMDDDISADAAMLEHLVRQASSQKGVIVLATLIPALNCAPGSAPNPFAVLYSRGAVFPGDVDAGKPVPGREPDSASDGAWSHFTRCKTGGLCIWHEDFRKLKMFQDPTGGWPNWDDVDFGYRAHRQGFRLWHSHRALAYHHDRSLESLELNCERQRRAGRSAARLFGRYPELAQYVLAFRDKGPMSFPGDSPGLLARKALRSLASQPLSVRVMRRLAHRLEARQPGSPLGDSVLALLYRWLISAHMYEGYRQGLHDLETSQQRRK